MLKYIVEQWDKNKEFLRQDLKGYLNRYFTEKYWEGYETLMQLCVKNILNHGAGEYERYSEKIQEIRIGEYQGEFFYVITPENETFGSVGGILVSYIEYGSCALCDMLEGILSDNKTDNEQKVAELLQLCKDMMCNVVKPYNEGWFHNERFDQIIFEADQ